MYRRIHSTLYYKMPDRKIERSFVFFFYYPACICHWDIFRAWQGRSLFRVVIVGAKKRAQPRRVSWRADELAGPRMRMKIHERLKSKAVDIHIQKMASLTLNGHHYAWCLPTRARSRPLTHTRVFACMCVSPHATEFPRETASVQCALHACIRGAHVSRRRHCSLACDDRRSSRSLSISFQLERVWLGV